jgi:hypothetical protein
MAKFHGKVGYAHTVETAPGVHEEVITERSYFGDISRTSRGLQAGERLNPSLTLGNSISIVADPYARDHFFAMRYVEWAGIRWTVQDVEVQHPRLLLRLGEVYNGLTATAPVSP